MRRDRGRQLSRSSDGWQDRPEPPPTCCTPSNSRPRDTESGFAFRDALERLCVRLGLLAAFGVALEHFAPGSGTCAGERIGRIDERCKDRFCFDFFMMRRDRIYDLRRLAVFARDLAADQRVRA